MTNEPIPLHAVLFDARDTLGEVDRPGHLIPYRPSTEQMLSALAQAGVKLGVITNLPDDVPDEAGRRMIFEAVLSQDPQTLRPNTIGRYIARENIVTNHQASQQLGKKVAKPSREIYEFAARMLEVPIQECLFVGENLNEVIGARIAGMQAERKQCPPGRDFAPALVAKIGGSVVDSGRAFEAFFEHEHLLGERIFACGRNIGKGLRELTEGKEPPLDKGTWISPPKVALPARLRTAIGFFVHLIDHFADQVHLRAEEAMVDVAVARGMDPRGARWMLHQHEQARAYWRGLDVAWKRIQEGDDDDRFYAIRDFRFLVEAFVSLFEAHAVRENDQLYPESGKHFGDSDDSMVLNLISHFGPPDITPFVAMVEAMEAALDGGAKP